MQSHHRVYDLTNDSDCDSEHSQGSSENQEAKTWKSELRERLGEIETCGDFATQKAHPSFVNPGIEVGGDVVPLPLTPFHAEKIKAAARPAPFGRGDETVVDPSVRRTWELGTNEFRFANPEWQGFLNTIGADAAHHLGLRPADVTFQPHKLLLYEEGSFFKRHKDSEKQSGMVGSLIVCLPSKHKGGEVHLSHMGKGRVFDTSARSSFNLTALAWYSDVTHEVKEVTEGLRLVLTYNIIQKVKAGMSAGFFVEQRTRLRDSLRKWHRECPDISRLVLFLDHKYSQDGLAASKLKGRDRAVFETLRTVCAESKIYILLTNVTKTQCDGDDDDGESGTCLDHVCNLEGRRVADNIDILDEDILEDKPYQDRCADSEDEGEYTGNESMPSQLRYHDSAILLIPRNNIFDLIRNCSNMAALLSVLTESYQQHREDPALRQLIVAFIGKGLEAQKPVSNRYAYTYMNTPGQSDTSVFTFALEALRTAWELDKSLYRKAVQSCYYSGRIPDVLLATIASIVNSEPLVPNTEKWDLCVGSLLDCPVSVDEIFKAFHSLNQMLERDDVKMSMRSWVKPQKRVLFDSNRKLTQEDYAYVLDMAINFWSDTNWVQNQFLTKLQNCEDIPLISRIIDKLSVMGRESTLAGAETVARQLLDFHLPRLCIRQIDLWAGDPKVVPLTSNVSSWDEARRFLTLIDTCLKSKHESQAIQLIRLSTEHLHENGLQTTRKRYLYSHVRAEATLAKSILYRLANILEENGTPLDAEVQNFFGHILNNSVIGKFPVCPVEPQGWEYSPRGCSPTCVWCRDLDQFLVDPYRQTAEFTTNQQNRKHIDSRLGEFFTCTTEKRRGSNAMTLIVRKKGPGAEYRKLMLKYKQDVGAIEDQTRVFRHERFRRILGDEKYRQMVMLEDVVGSEANRRKAAGGDNQPAAGNGGTKREADDELQLPPALRQRVD